ncbi:hypothetical protein KDD30_15390 [Photobacterium sp. GJ3]|uniref:hypothetical protein n=1 Tax=Photobacterium sp. GJ3 TaxID=2829502 RepID=UPI001B8B85D7|nr:hypothetical protein [Photobacterium sp. GJ3]QUJ67398.1 hypothetical protein KDD30_15390 [Photobacterium sp. GJ3]
MIYLSKYDVQFMLMILQLTPDLNQVLQAISKGGEITDDHADELRDCCTDKLDAIGFDENFEPTVAGRKLEVLTDKLYIG